MKNLNQRSLPKDAESIAGELEAWTNYAVSVKNFVLADKICRLKLIADRKNLSVPMMSDMIILTLKDNAKERSIEIEDILNDIW